MISSKTIKEYIKKCKSLDDSKDKEEVKGLVYEILNVLGNDITNLKEGIYSSGNELIDKGNNINYFNDLKLLKAKLQREYNLIKGNKPVEQNITNKQKKIFISHASKDI